MSTVTTYPHGALADVATYQRPRGKTLSLPFGAWHSGVALGVYAVALSLMDGLHMALRMPPVRPAVIWAHVFLGLAFYPLLISLSLDFTRRWRLDGERRMRNAVVHLAIGLLFQYFHYFIMRWMLAHVVWPVFYPGELFRPKLILAIGAQHFREYPIDLLAYWLVIAFEHASQYYSALGQREIAAAKLEASLAEARLDALRRQLSPHFLFNTLNTVSVLAMRGDKDAVVDTLSRLSDLLRIAIDEDRPQLVTLNEELSFLDGYLGIQQVRFGDRLKVSLNVAPESLTALVPSMVLQPLVENAIEHGASAKTGGTSLTIHASVVKSQLRLEVRDSGPGFSSRLRRSPSRGHGIGLANTSHRLQQLYGDGCSIQCGDSPGGGASVEVTLPFRPHPLTM